MALILFCVFFVAGLIAFIALFDPRTSRIGFVAFLASILFGFVTCLPIYCFGSVMEDVRDIANMTEETMQLADKNAGRLKANYCLLKEKTDQ